MSTSFVPSTYDTTQKLQQYAIQNQVYLKYDSILFVNTYVEQSINTFKNNFFSSSQTETVIAAQF